MSTTNLYKKYLNAIGDFIGKISKAIVSGIPTQKINIKPEKKEEVHLKNKNFKQDDEKHHHRPHSHPVTEKQTLLKETKKVKRTHK